MLELVIFYGGLSFALLLALAYSWNAYRKIKQDKMAADAARLRHA